MSINTWQEVLPSTKAMDAMPCEDLEKVGRYAECEMMTLSFGVSAIGSMLAAAALNEEHGLDPDKVADLGFLLESLGRLAGSLADTAEASHLRAKKRG